MTRVPPTQPQRKLATAADREADKQAARKAGLGKKPGLKRKRKPVDDNDPNAWLDRVSDWGFRA